MPFTPPDALLKPPASFNAPLTAGPSFLSGLLGGVASITNPFAGVAGAAEAIFGGPDAALQPDVNTLDAKQSLGLQFASPFQVGGKGNTQDTRPRLEASPVDSTKTATGAGSLGLDSNTLVLIGAALVAGLIFLTGFRRS